MKILLITLLAVGASFQQSAAQADNKRYPEPEFSNEIFFLKKDSVNSLVRLEKNSSKMENKVKVAGLGGAESGYTIEGDKSPVRINSGTNLSFVFSTGSSGSGSSNRNDSTLRSAGVDPSMFQGMGNMSDPTSTITLYKTDPGKNERKILMQKSGGMFSISHKIKSSDKYTFSVKKVREGYWELTVDKTLPKGEYAFTMMNMMSMDMSGGLMTFAFAVD